MDITALDLKKYQHRSSFKRFHAPSRLDDTEHNNPSLIRRDILPGSRNSQCYRLARRNHNRPGRKDGDGGHIDELAALDFAQGRPQKRHESLDGDEEAFIHVRAAAIRGSMVAMTLQHSIPVQ